MMNGYVSRTGIRERRIAADHECTSDLATAAAKRALDMAGIDAAEIDLIVLGTVTGDYPWPADCLYCSEQPRCGQCLCLRPVRCCSGFLYALASANDYILSGRGRRALVIGAETFSRIVDWTDRNTCVLFGDGAGAVVLEAQESESVCCHVICIPMAVT